MAGGMIRGKAKSRGNPGLRTCGDCAELVRLSKGYFCGFRRLSLGTIYGEAARLGSCSGRVTRRGGRS